MRAILALLLLAAAVFAQEDIAAMTGCEDHSSYYLCPQASIVQDAALKLSTDLTCGYTTEEEGCYATATLLADAKYEQCYIYVPNPLTDPSAVKRDYQCTTKTAAAGTEVEVITTSQWAHDCATTDNQTFYRYDTCKMNGEAFGASGTIQKEQGKYYVLASLLKRKEGYVEPTYILAGAVAAVAAIYFAVRKKK
jgi:hypothetical protein